MEPVAVLRRALETELTDADGDRIELDLLPALEPDEIAELESRLPCPVPPALRRLLSLCRGFYGSAAEVVDFTGEECPFEHAEIFPHGLPLAADGFGNFWVADLTPDSTDWAPIYFASHDPPVVLYQSPTLGHFLENLIDLSRPPHRSVVDDVHEDAPYDVWRKNSGVLPQAEGLHSVDEELRRFASQLDSSWQIADLRQAPIGHGFSWGRYGPKTEVRRHGVHRLFAYRRPPSAIGRLLGRR